MLLQMFHYNIHYLKDYKFEIVTKLQQFYFPPNFSCTFFQKKVIYRTKRAVNAARDMSHATNVAITKVVTAIHGMRTQ